MKVIHGSRPEEQRRNEVDANEYKTCPICGAVCFNDMDVCFGCLHRFDDDRPTRPIAKAPDATESPSREKAEDFKTTTSGDEEFAALLEQMRSHFMPTAKAEAEAKVQPQEQVADPAQKPVIMQLDSEQKTQTKPDDAEPGITARHVCAGRDGQQFEISISIKML